MSDKSPTFAERAARFAQLCEDARSPEERESYRSIAQGYRRLAEGAPGRSDAEPPAAETAPLKRRA